MLSQSDADYLVDLDKKKVNDKTYDFPDQGNRIAIPICSLDERESFIFDINRRTIALSYQSRYGKVHVLRRLDLSGRPHTNPITPTPNVPNYLHQYAGKKIPCPHIHIYVENSTNDRWAMPINDSFSDIDNIYKTFDEFLDYLKVVDRPNIQETLFN